MRSINQFPFPSIYIYFFSLKVLLRYLWKAIADSRTSTLRSLWGRRGNTSPSSAYEQKLHGCNSFRAREARGGGGGRTFPAVCVPFEPPCSGFHRSSLTYHVGSSMPGAVTQAGSLRMQPDFHVHLSTVYYFPLQVLTQEAGDFTCKSERKSFWHFSYNERFIRSSPS